MLGQNPSCRVLHLLSEAALLPDPDKSAFSEIGQRPLRGVWCNAQPLGQVADAHVDFGIIRTVKEDVKLNQRRPRAWVKAAPGSGFQHPVMQPDVALISVTARGGDGAAFALI